MSRGAGEQGCGGAKALERYLNSACTGLFGLERQTVRDELEANLLERVREFQVMGCSSDVALEKALEEFGAPSSVRRGMREVYIMPKVMKGGVLFGVLAMGAYLAVSASVAGPVPISLCVGDRIDTQILEQGCPSNLSFLKLEDIRADFAKQGFQLNGNRTRLTLEQNGETLLNFKWDSPGEATTSFKGKPYIQLNSLFNFNDDTQSEGSVVRFNRLVNPTLELGGAKLQPTSALGNKRVDINIPVAWRISYLVHQAIDPKSQEFGYGNSIRYTRLSVSFTPERKYKQTYTQAGDPGRVYALAWIRKDPDLKRNPAKYLKNEFVETALATATADGKLVFATHVPRFDLTNSLEEFKQARGKKAILLELTGRLDNAAPAFVVVQNPPSSSGAK